MGTGGFKLACRRDRATVLGCVQAGRAAAPRAAEPPEGRLQAAALLELFAAQQTATERTALRMLQHEAGPLSSTSPTATPATATPATDVFAGHAGQRHTTARIKLVINQAIWCWQHPRIQ